MTIESDLIWGSLLIITTCFFVSLITLCERKHCLIFKRAVWFWGSTDVNWKSHREHFLYAVSKEEWQFYIFLRAYSASVHFKQGKSNWHSYLLTALAVGNMTVRHTFLLQGRRFSHLSILKLCYMTTSELKVICKNKNISKANVFLCDLTHSEASIYHQL